MHIEDKYAQSIAIVFPAAIRAEHSLPIDQDIKQHCTLSYLGEIPDISYTLDELLTALQAFPRIGLQTVATSGLELFGPEYNFLVLLLNPDGLADMKYRLVDHLRNSDITVADRFPHYRPHLTLQEGYTDSLDELTGEIIPKTVELGAPELWWGNTTYAFA